jgi:hypothetical protein
MQLERLEFKKVYYYAICLIAFFVLMWGVIDMVSSSLGIVNISSPLSTLPPSAEESALPNEKGGEQFLDVFYQKKMLYDRFGDSLARIIVSGIIFAYSRYKVSKLEPEA